MADLSDLALIRRIAARDEAALETLYQRYGGELLGTLNILLRDPLASEDALQMVMMAVWQNAHTFRGESAVTTWLHAIARRQAMSANRKTRDIQPMPDEDLLTADAPEAEADGHDALHAAMRHLPEMERLALDLVYNHELTLAQAAERLGIPVNTVKSRLSRARTALRRWLKHEENDYVR